MYAFEVKKFKCINSLREKIRRVFCLNYFGKIFLTICNPLKIGRHHRYSRALSLDNTMLRDPLVKFNEPISGYNFFLVPQQVVLEKEARSGTEAQ